MKPSFRRKRQGTVVIMVLACAAVVVFLVLAAVQISLKQRHQLRREYQLEQTRWVLDAAIRRAQQSQKLIQGENLELSLSPKLPKFESTQIRAEFEPSTDSINVRAVIETNNGNSVTKRSASFRSTNAEDK